MWRWRIILFFSWVCVYSLWFQNRRNNNAVVPQPYPGYFMSCIVFKLPSSIAVVGVPLQLFLLAVCWQNNSCYCFARIDFHRTAPSKAYLQATTLQQNINAVSFLAFLRRKKKKHFQQSSAWDAIYSGHIEDRMLIFKGLKFPPHQQTGGKVLPPAISVQGTKSENWSLRIISRALQGGHILQ